MITAAEARELALATNKARADWDPVKGPLWIELMTFVQNAAARGAMRIKVHNIPNEVRERLVESLGFTFTLDKNEEFLSWG